MSSWISAVVHADSAKAMGNGMYSILLGLAIRGILIDPNLNEWPLVLLALYSVLLVYYILDWLSYNARLQLSTPQLTFAELAGNIISILIFGGGINFCLRLLDKDGHLPNDASWAVIIFQMFFSLYLFLTTVGLLWVAKYRPFTSSNWQMVDIVLRVVVFTISLMLLCFSAKTSVILLLIIYSTLAVILVGSKAFRYVRLFLMPASTPTISAPTSGAE